MIVSRHVLHLRTGVVHASTCESLRFVPAGRLRAANVVALGASARVCSHCFALPAGVRRPPARIGELDEAGIRWAAARHSAARILALIAAAAASPSAVGRFLERVPPAFDSDNAD